MRKFAWLPAAAVISLLLCVAPVVASGLTIGPAEVELDVPAAGSATIEFFVSDFTGDLEISLEDIPLTVEPGVVHVEAPENNALLELTLYGNESLGDCVFDGKILFLAQSSGSIAYGIKVKATVNHINAGQPDVKAGVSENAEAVPDLWVLFSAGALVLGLAGVFLIRRYRNAKN